MLIHYILSCEACSDTKWHVVITAEGENRALVLQCINCRGEYPIESLERTIKDNPVTPINGDPRKGEIN